MPRPLGEVLVGVVDDAVGPQVADDVARIVGMSNLVPAEVEWDGRVRVDAEHGIAVDLAATRRFAPDAAVWTGIRPERPTLDVGRGEGVPIGKGVVRTVVGDGVAATVGIEWAGLERRTHLPAGRGLARTIRAGDSVTLSVRPEDVHLIPRH